MRNFRVSGVIHDLKRIWLRFAIYYLKNVNTRIQDLKGLSDEEKRISGVIRRIIKKPDSDILLSPNSSRYFIKNDKTQILIIFQDGEASVINHIYGYNVRISQKTFNLLYRLLIKEMEKRRDHLEEEYRNNMQRSLDNIMLDIID